MRIKDEVNTVGLNEDAEDDPSKKTLFSLVKDEEGNYFIDTEKKTPADKLWLVVRAMKNEGGKLSYELKKSDIIKLGRIQFRVKDIQTEKVAKNDPKDVVMNEDIEDVRSVITSNDSKPPEGEGQQIPQ